MGQGVAVSDDMIFYRGLPNAAEKEFSDATAGHQVPE
jgi:hypothetical protein